MPRIWLLARTHVVLLCALVFFAGCVALSAWQEPELVQQLFIAALMLCTFVMLLFAFARVAAALLVSGGLFLALKFIAAMKLRYLDSQLMPSDFIYYVRTSLLDTLRHYPHMLALGVGLCVIVPPLLYLAWRRDWRFLAGLRPRVAAGVRIGGIVLGVLAFWLCMLPTGPFAQVHSRNVWEKLSDDAQLTNFFVNFRDSDVQLPSMASDAVAE
ncbi:MAG TPA: sulfatase, partial [Rhodanobacter sp.]|nr:sulfatase [Rhodanobacter sp.]